MPCNENDLNRKKINTVASLLFILVLYSWCSADAEELGYDANTEVSIAGIVLNSVSNKYKDYHTFHLQTDSILIKVITAPPWYIRQINFEPRKGSNLKVVGSKFYGHDGSVCLIARSIHYPGTGGSIVLRDRRFKPVWNLNGIKESSCLMVTHPKP